MNPLLRARVMSLDELRTETFATEISMDTPSNSRSKKISKPRAIGSRRRSKTSSTGSYVVDYGPIRVRHRRSQSQTLATGRRSKDEPLDGEEAMKREIRRARNRMSARDLKKTRDQIEFDLIQKVKELEQEKNLLQEQHKLLEIRKAQLNRAVYNAKQAPLIPLVTDINIPVFFEPQQRHDLLIDLQPLLKTIDEQFCLSEC